MIIEKTVWVIMDKNRKIIGSGVPRNRELKFVNDPKGTSRILTYPSRGYAEAGFKSSGFYMWNGVGDYVKETYGKGRDWYEIKDEEFLEAVEVKMTLEEICKK